MKTLICLGILLAALSLRAQAPDASTFSLAPGDVSEAIIDTSGPARLKVMLTPEKSAELSAFTGLNVNKQVRIVVGGKLRSTPFIRERMTGPSMELYVTSNEDALGTVRTLLTATRPFDQLYKWRDASGQSHYSEKAPASSSDQASPAAQITDDRASNLLKDLQGSWEVIKATMNGKETGDRSLVEGKWKFQGNELVLQSPTKGIARFAVEVDAKAEPKAFHVTSIEPANSGSGWMLFSREAKALRIAFYDNLEGRPTSFEPRELPAEPELVVVTLGTKK